MGIYNFTTGISLFTKTPAGRNFVYVDERAIYVKKEMKKLNTFEWQNIDKICIRRSGVQIYINGENDRISYDMLPYREVKEFQTTLVELGKKKDVTVTLDMGDTLETE